MGASMAMEKTENVINLLNILNEIQILYPVQFYFVGGCVRNHFWNLPSFDYDIAVDGDLNWIQEYWQAHNLIHRFPFQSSSLETLKFQLAPYELDLAKFRSEKYNKSNGIPDIFPGDITSDLNRRDFTVNTGYVKLSASVIDKMVHNLFENTINLDYCHALFYEDIQNRTIRILHNQSFNEDASRLLRAIYYCISYEATLEVRTQQLFNEAIDSGQIRCYSKPRYRQLLLHYLYSASGWNFIHQLEKEGLIIDSGQISNSTSVRPELEQYPFLTALTEMDLKTVYLLLIYDKNLEFWIEPTQ